MSRAPEPAATVAEVVFEQLLQDAGIDDPADPRVPALRAVARQIARVWAAVDWSGRRDPAALATWLRQVHAGAMPQPRPAAPPPAAVAAFTGAQLRLMRSVLGGLALLQFYLLVVAGIWAPPAVLAVAVVAMVVGGCALWSRGRTLVASRRVLDGEVAKGR